MLCWRSVDALLAICWRSVDTLLTLCWRSVDALLTLFWRSVDAVLTLCWRSSFHVVATTVITLPIQAANTLIIDKSHSLALALHQMQHPKLLTLCLCSVDALFVLCGHSVVALLTLCWHSLLGVMTSIFTILTIQESNTPIMGPSHSTALGLYKIQHPESMTLCWHSFSEWGCDHVAFSFANKGCQYVDYG